MQTISLLSACLFSIVPLVDCAKVSSTSYATIVMEADDDKPTPNATSNASDAKVMMKAPVAVRVPDQSEYKEVISEKDEEKIPEAFRLPGKRMNEIDNPQCFSHVKGAVEKCESRSCISLGYRKKDGRPCYPDNCYCRCLIMSTGGRFCDEWVAEGCRDNDGCFRASDFPGLLHKDKRWRSLHPEVVLAATITRDEQQANKHWRASENWEEFFRNVIASELPDMALAAQVRLDMPMYMKIADLQKVLRTLQSGNLTLEEVVEELF